MAEVWPRSLANADSTATRFRLLATTLAVRAYRLEQGSPPRSLKDLVPTYLPGVPEDPFGPGGRCASVRARSRSLTASAHGQDGHGHPVVNWRETPGRSPGDLRVVLGKRDEKPAKR